MCVAFKSHSLSVECLFSKIRFESKGKFISLGSAIQYIAPGKRNLKMLCISGMGSFLHTL
jgi:hypothetical protein